MSSCYQVVHFTECPHQGGLFSAVLTAFNVQSYQLLTPPPNTDPVILALERISAQLSSFSVNPPSVNSTHPAFVYHNPSPLSAPQYAVWLNTLWFASLIFSLSAASIGIMVKQWLNEYSSGLSGKSRQIARLRQLRMNSLRQWRVKEIVAVLPVLLQIASALFFSGLLVLLWQLNRIVAITATGLISALIVFSLSTIILPSVTEHCSYLSPPSLAFYEVTRLLPRFIRTLRHHLSSWIISKYCDTSLPLMASERDVFKRTHPDMYRLWTYIYPDDSIVQSALKWQGKELALLTKLGRSSKLDGDSVVTAYTIGMDTNYLHHASVCITELGFQNARKCFLEIRSANMAHWGEGRYTDPMQSVHPCMWSGAIVFLMHAASQGSSHTPPSVIQELDDMYSSISLSRQHVSSSPSHTRLLSLDFERMLHYYKQVRLPSDTTDMMDSIFDIYLQVLMMHSSNGCIGNEDHELGECTVPFERFLS